MLRCQHASHRCSASKLQAVTVIVLMPRIFVSCCLASFTEHSHSRQPHSSQLGFVLNHSVRARAPISCLMLPVSLKCEAFRKLKFPRHPRRLENMFGFAHSLFETPVFYEVSWPPRAFPRHRVFETISRHFVGFGAYFVCVAYVVLPVSACACARVSSV